MRLCHHRTHGPVQSFELGYRPLGAPLMTVRCYLVDGLLVDSGLHHVEQALVQALQGQKLHQIALTHHHEDHSGNAAALGAHFSVPILAHPLTAERLQQRVKMLPYRHIIWGRAPAADMQPLPDSVKTEHHNFQVLNTPGHCRDHVVFLEPQQGWLFAGDLYLGERIRYFRANEDLTTMLDSLSKVCQYEFSALFCAHRPVFTGGQGKLKAKLDGLQNFVGEVTDLLQKGLTEREIFQHYQGREQWSVRLLTFGDASFANMLRAAIRTGAQRLSLTS